MHLAIAGVVQALQQCHKGRLAASAAAHQGYKPPGPQLHAHLGHKVPN